MRLEERRVVGYEALARWTNPDVGEVSPGDFIPIAELTSEIIPIGQCMLSQVAAFASDLRDSKGEELRVTLNVSPLELDQPGFAEAVREAFESEGLGGGALGIEITEGTLLESGAREEENIASLRDFGARVLLDDFGTGYSSLGYLRDFQIDTIKIDRSFVAKMTDDHHSAALIQAILAMARGLEMEVVAEGVETEEQAKLLRLLGCRYGQGFGLGRPSSAAAALAMRGDSHRANRL
jgi:EAL domain-containing protein (putative c-di-GMP-specific phosphodiesterase class I)